MLLGAYIKIIDARKASGLKSVRHLLQLGHNFVLILPPSQVMMRKYCRLIDCYPDVPDKLGRWAIHALNDVLASRDYKRLLRLHHEGCPLFFVEPLKLHHSRPPNLNEFIVYCELRGIVAHFDSLKQARSTLERYIRYFRRAGLFPLAGIYNWAEGGWSRLRNTYLRGKPARTQKAY